MQRFYRKDPDILEIGVDEAGRGPLFGRVYSAAVILPKDETSFDHSQMKDSKKFYSNKKIVQASEYIKTHAIAWGIAYEDETVIDNVNILQATQSAMHKAIKQCKHKLGAASLPTTTTSTTITPPLLILVDGNYFKQITEYNKDTQSIMTMSHICIEGGDNKYTSIAAASILAKVARDEYIQEMCVENPTLIEYYGLDTNKGYGTKKHLDGIKKYGITEWHRPGFCKNLYYG